MTIHKVGDIVRLNRGWTPMCVIGIHHNDDVIAKYINRNNSWADITKDCYINPLHHYSYIRPQSGFVVNDIKFNKKVLKPMNQNYKTIMNYEPPFVGKHVGTVADGRYIIEGPNGAIRIIALAQLELDIPWTFAAKSTVGYHTCHYSLLANTNVFVGDLLLSDSGNMYTVTALDTKQSNPKGVFTGKRVQLKDI